MEDQPFIAEYVMQQAGPDHLFKFEILIFLRTKDQISLIFGSHPDQKDLYGLIDALLFMAPNLIQTVTMCDYENDRTWFAAGIVHNYEDHPM